MRTIPTQLQLFAAVTAAYADAPDGRLDNATLYAAAGDRAGVPTSERKARKAVGVAAQSRNLYERAVRWHQQTLKLMGVLRRAPGERGVWELMDRTPKGLHRALSGVRLLAFSTNLGVAIWGDCVDTFERLDTSSTVAICSPPYCLSRPRAYGNPSDAEYVDFIVASLKPIVERLVPGGSVCINLGQDIFLPGLPARSMINERLLLALHDRLGLKLLDRLIWCNGSKPPGPTYWSSRMKVQLTATYEFIYWLSPSPELVRADNRRVLLPHTEKHLRLISAGGETRDAVYGDGAYHVRPGSFGNATPGRIPRNVLHRGGRCADTLQYRRDAAALRLPAHGATMPLSIPDFLIRYLSEPGDLVVDPFGGTAKTGMAAERLGRRWVVTEHMLTFLRPSGERFRQCDGFYMPEDIEVWPARAA